jgi:hypothetical protein
MGSIGHQISRSGVSCCKSLEISHSKWTIEGEYLPLEAFHQITIK